MCYLLLVAPRVSQIPELSLTLHLEGKGGVSLFSALPSLSNRNQK